MYNHKKIEKKWQNYWFKNNLFKTTNNHKENFFVLDMFPYPSGSGLHVGHPLGYTATDIIARYKRLKGFDVLHAIGWDAFGLPAEQYALKTGNHPKLFVKKNIDNFRKQLKSMGFSYDYDKEINTTDPNYYKTTQWIFLQLYKNNLAKIKNVDVNWCEKLGTVLANEEIETNIHGKSISKIGNFPIVKKPMKQWVLLITKYADKLFDDLDDLEWSKSLKKLQKNWIKNQDGNLHLRDWIFSRQRYWGEPFPIIFDVVTNKIKLVEKLPLELPFIKNIKLSNNGESPLANLSKWINFKENDRIYRHDTNTMPQWAGSCWYYLAYILKQKDGYLDINSSKAKKLFKKWLPVDLYIGGQEHAVLHLLYARFWHKFLYDQKIVPTKEPFFKVVNQGMILGEDGNKMSKSKGNVVNPDEIIFKYGADALRIYEMFMGPLIDTKPWKIEGIIGIRKWLDRVYRIFELFKIGKEYQIDNSIKDDKFIKIDNFFIKKITNLIEQLKFNIAISELMIFINKLYKYKKISSKKILNNFLIIFSCFAPHLAEELLKKMNFLEVFKSEWPKYNEKNIIKNPIVIGIQVLGKLRGTINVVDSWDKETIIKKAQEVQNVQKYLTNKKIKKIIYVHHKIINFIY